MSWIMGLLGAGAETAAGYYNSKAEQAQHKMDAAVHEINAMRAALEANFAEEAVRRAGRKKVARLSAALAENGLQGASFDKILEQSIQNTSLDALNTRNERLSEFYNYKNAAAQSRFQARQAASARKSATALGLAKAAAYTLYGLNKHYNGQDLADKKTLAKDFKNYIESDVYKGATLKW